MKKEKREPLQVEFICPACGKHLAWALPASVISCPCGQWVTNKNRKKADSEIFLPVNSEQTVLF